MILDSGSTVIPRQPRSRSRPTPNGSTTVTCPAPRHLWFSNISRLDRLRSITHSTALSAVAISMMVASQDKSTTGFSNLKSFGHRPSMAQMHQTHSTRAVSKVKCIQTMKNLRVLSWRICLGPTFKNSWFKCSTAYKARTGNRTQHGLTLKTMKPSRRSSEL